MFSDAVKLIAATWHNYRFTDGFLYAFSIFLSVAIAWLTWGVWTFTIHPALHPDEPKQLPYWIPFLGHVGAFMKNSNEVFSYGRRYFGNTREPFSLTIMGETLYIITSPHDVSTIYKATKSLAFDPFIQDVLSNFGISSESIRKMYQEPMLAGEGQAPSTGGTKGRTFMQKSHDDWKQQLHPGELLTALQRRFLKNIEEYLQFDRIPREAILSSSNSQRVVSLFTLCSEVLLRSATRGLLGDDVTTMAPELLPSFFAFDRENWKLNYKYPYFAAREMYDAKVKGVESVMNYFATSKSQKPDAAWIITTLREGFRSLNMDERENASMIFMMYWVANSNAYKLCFWFLVYLLYDPVLLEKVRQETRPAFQNDEVDMDYLWEHCPQLESVYEEILRVMNAPIGARTTMSDVWVGGRMLKAGTKVLMPYRQLHLDENVFGSDAGHFKASRFLENRNLSRSSSLRPFGGGTTYCPGRFIVRREAYLFVAVIIHCYEVALEGDSTFPRPDEETPTGGIIVPVKGDDVLVRLTPLER